MSISDIQKANKSDPAVTVATLGQEVVALKLSNMQKDSTIQAMGQQLALVKLELIQMKGGGN